MGQTALIISAAVALKQGQMQKSAYEDDARSNLERADEAKLESEQKEIARKRQLSETLSALSGTMANAGVSVSGGGSVSNLARRENKLASDDVGAIKYMGLSKQRQFKLGASSARKSGKAAELGSYAKAANAGSKVDGKKLSKEWA